MPWPLLSMRVLFWAVAWAAPAYAAAQFYSFITLDTSFGTKTQSGGFSDVPTSQTYDE